MTARTYSDAFALARPLRFSHGPGAAAAAMSRLLWHVDREQGGFIGLSDAEIEEKCASDRCLNFDAAISAMYAPGDWPGEGKLPVLGVAA